MLAHLNYYWNELTLPRLFFLLGNIAVGIILPFIFTKTGHPEGIPRDEYMKIIFPHLALDTLLRIFLVRARVRDFEGNTKIWTYLGFSVIIAMGIAAYSPLKLLGYAIFLCAGITWMVSFLYFFIRRGNS